MKVLLSAYACEPGKGSEPGVGWHWALEIARLGHDVHVITRANNRAPIDAARARGEVPANLTFHYFDLKPWQRFWKRGNRGVHLYTILWQWGASQVALRLHAREKFDLVHHVTFGSTRLPSFMWRLGIRFVVGPLGGGESAPGQLRKHFPLRGKIVDALRDASNWLGRFDPLARKMYAGASAIYLKTRDSLWCVPAAQRSKATASVEIGIDAGQMPQRQTPDGEALRVLFVGRHIYWKGMGLGLKAFALARQSCPELVLTMVGDGPEADAWQALAQDLGIAETVTWRGWVQKHEVKDIYAASDLFLFPSLHDSSGNVVLEAAAAGLPVVCLDLGGPGTIVTARSGIKVPADQRSEAEVIDALARTMVRLARDPALLQGLSQSARQWSQTMTWESAVGAVYGRIEQGELPRHHAVLPK